MARKVAAAEITAKLMEALFPASFPFFAPVKLLILACRSSETTKHLALQVLTKKKKKKKYPDDETLNTEYRHPKKIIKQLTSTEPVEGRTLGVIIKHAAKYMFFSKAVTAYIVASKCCPRGVTV